MTNRVGSRFAFESGGRVDRTTLTRETVGSPWVGLSWDAPRGFSIRAGGGLYQQFPDFDQVAGSRDPRWTPNARRTPTSRSGSASEADSHGRPWASCARSATAAADPSRVSTAAACGSILDEPVCESRRRLIERRRSVGHSARALTVSPGGSCYAITLQRDRATGETFRADFDQRHTFTRSAFHRFTNRLSVGAKVRAGQRPARHWILRAARRRFT
jgi:hypothetical protein